MIKNINQSMINRSIAGGGGVNCKCSNGGSNGGVNGGKITVEIPVYVVEETSGTPPTLKIEQCITKEDVERIFNAILGVDPEKYTIYQVTEKFSDIYESSEAKHINIHSCTYEYTQAESNGTFMQTNNIVGVDLSFNIVRNDGTIVFDVPRFRFYDVVDTLPGTAIIGSTYTCALYYREL